MRKKKRNRTQPNEIKKRFIDSEFVLLDEKDYLENYIYSDELSSKIDSYFKSKSSKPLYLGVIGSWGSGKTSIVETALKKQDKAKIFRYDAWKYEEDSFRRSFIKNMLLQSGIDSTEKIYKDIDSSLYEDYSISANSIIERIKLSRKKDMKINIIQIITTIIILALITAFGIYNLCIDKKVIGDIFTVFGTIGLFDVFYSTTVFSKSKLFSSEQFYNSFVDILSNTAGKNNIILIDNLDRCNKEEVRKTLNTIKGFYIENDEKRIKNEKVVFIIPLDINSLNDAYSKYTIHYLDKIFDDTIYIKKKYNTDIIDYINRLLKEYPDIEALINNDSKGIIVNGGIDTPREIIKTINDYTTEYDLLLKRTSKEFAEKIENRDFLMKMVIIKRKYYSFFKLAYSSLHDFKRQTEIIVEEELKKYEEEKYNELLDFLAATRSVEPTNYYEFFQNQGIKSYNQLPETIKKAIMSHKIEVIKEYKEKEKIKTYYTNIHDDIINGFWDSYIINKYITLIELYKERYFNENELPEIVNAWNDVFKNEKFRDMNIKHVDVIGFDNELTFAKGIYNNKDFTIFIIDSIKDDKFKFENETEKYEMLKKWLIKNQNIQLNEDYSELLNMYCEFLLNNELYSHKDYICFLFGKNINSIRMDIITQFIAKNDDNNIIIKLIKNIKEEELNDSLVVDEILNWINNNEIENIDLLAEIYDYLLANNKNISNITSVNISLPEPVDRDILSKIIKYYSDKNVYNKTLFNMLKKITNTETIEVIIKDLTSEIPKDNEEYINNLIEYYFGLPEDVIKKNIKYLPDVIKKYENKETDVLKQLIETNNLKEYYDFLKTPEEREHMITISIALLSNNFKNELNNIFIFETSHDRLQRFISSHNLINDKVLIINKIKKQELKIKAIDNLIENIEEKENIVDEEIKAIGLLKTDNKTKSKIKKILLSKEKINKELVESEIVITTKK